jgi:hypothetical protein
MLYGQIVLVACGLPVMQCQWYHGSIMCCEYPYRLEQTILYHDKYLSS